MHATKGDHIFNSVNKNWIRIDLKKEEEVLIDNKKKKCF